MPKPPATRIHIGAGAQHLDGWINVDLRPLPGVDVVADVTQGLAFRDARAVYAEHFLEHLWPDQALAFLSEVRKVLDEQGRLRLSTPNLDWVWRSHYRLDVAAVHKKNFAVMLNRAFHGWEHKFLWNRELLAEALEAAGFEDLRWHRYGQSESDLFQGIERHETYEDDDETPHVVIVEAGRGRPDAQALAALCDRFRREYLEHVAAY